MVRHHLGTRQTMHKRQLSQKLLNTMDLSQVWLFTDTTRRIPCIHSLYYRIFHTNQPASIGQLGYRSPFKRLHAWGPYYRSHQVQTVGRGVGVKEGRLE
jgi:hypothetical protein